MATFLFAPTPHDEAIAAIAGKPALTRDQFEKLLPELKAYAFTITGVQSFDVLQDIRDRIATLPAGGDWDQIKGSITEDLVPYFVDETEDAETQDKQRAAAERRAELLIRTHGSQAYAATAYRLADAQRDLFPYWQYQTLGDANVRESHAALDGLVLPANHPFWADHTPPWDWGCRCQFIPLSAEDVEEMKQQDAGKPPELQRVLDEDQLRLLEETSTVWRPRNLAEGKGDPAPYSVASPAQRGQENPYTWTPSASLVPPMEKLRERYDAATWGAFTQWAEKTVIPDQKRTIMEWLSGSKVLTPASPAKLPVDTSTPKTAEALRPELEKLTQGLAEKINANELALEKARAANDWLTVTTLRKQLADLRSEGRTKLHPLLALPGGLQASVDIQTFAKNDNHAQGMAFVNSVIHKDLFTGAKVEVKRTATRAHADPFGRYINGKAMDVQTVVHELGHTIEARNPEVLKRSLAFRASRTPGEKAKWLGPGYKRAEVALDDKFKERGGSAYSGKVYTHQGKEYASEIVSMGIERLYHDPAGFFAKDPEYFNFIVDTLRTL